MNNVPPVTSIRGRNVAESSFAPSPPLDVYTPPNTSLGQNQTLAHLQGMSSSVINGMRWKWWTSHTSFNKNARRLGRSCAADLVDLTELVTLCRLLRHYEHSSVWPVRQAEGRFTKDTLNEMATMIINVLNC